jgi:hypothetical protein
VLTIVVSSGGGSVSAAAFKTNAAGVAAFRWTLGTTGAQSVLVTLNNGGASTTFTARLIPPGAELRVVGGNNQTGTPGDSLPLEVRVRLVDAAGDPIPNAAGVPIRWTALAAQGGGSLRFTTGRLTNAGTSINRWKLGWGTATQKLVAKITDVDSVIFTATASAAGYTLEVYNGNNQAGPPNTQLPTPLAIRVRNGGGTPIEGAEGTFAVTSGGGSLSRTNITTNSLGRATTNWTLGTSGVQQVTATVPLIGSVTFNATIALVSNYDIEVRYITTPTAAQQAAVNAAVARWRQVITGDLPDINMVGAPAACGDPAVNSVVDDIVIFVNFAFIDGAGGILGSAGPCYYRSGSFLPITGALQLDAADLAGMEADGSMQDVILHEIGHILGIGTLWDAKTPSLIDFASTDSVRFNGALATSAFNTSGGLLFAGLKVPVENCVGIPGCGPGTINGHWRELVMGRELMTGYLSGATRPLSLITVQSLGDLGYTVNTSAADAYSVSASLRATPEPAGRLLNEAPRRYAPRPFPQ